MCYLQFRVLFNAVEISLEIKSYASAYKRSRSKSSTTPRASLLERLLERSARPLQVSCSRGVTDEVHQGTSSRGQGAPSPTASSCLKGPTKGLDRPSRGTSRCRQTSNDRLSRHSRCIDALMRGMAFWTNTGSRLRTSSSHTRCILL